MKIFQTLFIMLAFLLIQVTESNAYFPDPVNTGTNITIAISGTPTIEGNSITDGDELGIFDQDGNCYGKLVWPGTGQFPAWGQSTLPDGTVLEGFESNEPFQWRIYDASEGKEYCYVNVTTAPGSANAYTGVLNSFTVVAAVDQNPDKPSAIYPSDFAILIPAEINFDWDTPKGGKYYNIQISKESDFSPIETQHSTTGNTFWNDVTIDYNTQYYWRVQAEDANGNTSGYNAFSFTTVEDGAISGSDNVCLNSTNTYTTASIFGVIYSWSVTDGTIQTVNSNEVTVLWNTAGTGRLVVTRTNQFTTKTIDSHELTVTVHDAPAQTITGDADVCYQETGVTYTAGGTFDAGATHSWSVTGGTIAADNGDNIDVDWGTGISGKIELITTSPYGCSNTVDFDVTIHELPNTAFTGPNSVCENSSETYLFSGTMNTGDVFVWTVTGGTITHTGSDYIDVDWGTTGSGSVELKHTNTWGCDSFFDITVTINPNPVPTISGDADVCENSTHTYTEATAGMGNMWDVEGGTINGSDNGSSVDIDWGTAGTAKVKLTQTNNLTGCNTYVEYSVTINANPVTPTISSTDGTDACLNETYTYNTPVNAALTNQWSVTGGTISGGASGDQLIVDWDQAGAGTVQLTQTNASGCTNSATWNHYTNDLPNVNISGDDDVIEESVENYSVNYDANVTNTWTVSGGTVQHTGSDYISVEWGTPGNGSVKVDRVNTVTGCSNSYTMNIIIRSKILAEYPDPDAVDVEPNVEFEWSNPAGVSNYDFYLADNHSMSSPIETVMDTPNLTYQVASNLDYGKTYYWQVYARTQGSWSSIFEFTVVSAPTISGSTDACVYDVNFDNSYIYSAPDNANLSYSWTVTGGTYVTLDNHTIEVEWSNTNAGNIELTRTSPKWSSFSDTYDINPTIHQNPTPVISGPTSVCEGETYTYSVSSAGLVNTWSVPVGGVIVDDRGDEIDVMWNNGALAGTVEINSVDTWSCPGEDDLQVTINPNPVFSISGEDEVCQYDTETYSASTAGTSNTWSVTNGTIIGTNFGTTVLVEWDGTSAGGEVECIKTDVLTGCTTTETFTVTINPLPQPDVQGNDDVCATTRNFYTADNTGMDNHWTVTGGTIVGDPYAETIAVDWGAAGTGTVACQQTNLTTGCIGTSSMNVTINPIITVASDIDYDKHYSTYWCIFEPVEFEGWAASSMSNWNWYITGTSGTHSYTGQNITHSFDELGTYSVKLEVSGPGCTIGTTTLSVTVTSNCPPTVAFDDGSQLWYSDDYEVETCKGTAVTVDSRVFGGSGVGYNYSVSPRGSVSASGDLDKAPGFTVSNPQYDDNYTFTVEDKSTLVAGYNEMSIAVNNPPRIVMRSFIVVGRSEAASGIDLWDKFNVSIVGGDATDTYFWTDKSSFSSTDQHATYSLSSPKRVYLTVNKGTDCPSDEEDGLILVRGPKEFNENYDVIPTLAGDNLIMTYPNPVVDILNVETIFAQAENVEIRVYNSIGQKVITTSSGGAASYNNVLDMSDLPSGMYILQVQFGDQNLIKKIIKQ